jgi:cytochrome b561
VWLVWRLVATAPAAQTEYRVTRLVLYGLLLIVPLSGWILVSAAVFKVPTFVFGALWLPHLPWFEGVGEPQAAAHLTGTVHTVLGVVFAIMVALHLVQSFRAGRDVLYRMIPSRRR